MAMPETHIARDGIVRRPAADLQTLYCEIAFLFASTNMAVCGSFNEIAVWKLPEVQMIRIPRSSVVCGFLALGD